MLSCDTCKLKLSNDMVFKPCGHRMHKKCDSDDGQCTSCDTEAQQNKIAFYGFLVLAGLLIGMMLCYTSFKPNGVHQLVRDLESKLIKIEKMADTSSIFRLTAIKSLERINILIDQEMVDLTRRMKTLAIFG